MKNLHTVLHFAFPPTACKCSNFSTLVPTLVLCFLIITLLTSVRLYLIMVLFCISLKISNVEHFFIYLLAICMSFLEKYLFKSFAHFLIRSLVLFLLFFCRSSLHILEINPLLDIWFANIFSCSSGINFHSVDCVLRCTEVLNFDEVQLIYFCYYCLYFWCHIQEIIAKPSVMKFFPCVFF